MTVYRQSHSQQTRTWGHATATLWRNCACGVGKDRMRAGRVTYPRQEKPICAQVALFTESVAVNRDNGRQGLRIAQAQARGILRSKRVLSRPSSRPTLHGLKALYLRHPSYRPTSSHLANLTNTDASPTREASRAHRASTIIQLLPSFKVGRLDVKANNQQSNHQTNRKPNHLIASGTLAIFPRAGVKARGILLGIAVYDWLINDKNNNKNSYLKANNS